jgi:hypothetical protein
MSYIFFFLNFECILFKKYRGDIDAWLATSYWPPWFLAGAWW